MAGPTTFLNLENNAASLLVAEISAAAVSLAVTAGDGAEFPADTFHISIDNEIILCTSRSTDDFTITRAQEGTVAAIHLVGAEVRLNITAKHITDLNTAVNFIEKYADYGLAFFGAVTTYTDTTHFKVSSLAGLGASTFLPASGTPYEIFVFKADGAAPQGEQKPVVAYTTGDGTFQHAAFTSPLAEDDEVLIIHPLLASLGTKATAAASGAVTTTDYMMAYIKQLVTELIVVDTVVDGIQTDLDNGTDGLHRLLAWIQYYGDKLDAPAGLGGLAPTLAYIVGLLTAAGGLGGIPATLAAFYLMFVDPATGFAAIQNTVTAVLLDTGTTLPATLATIDTVVDGIHAATRGSGPRSLETLGEDQDAELDVARGTSGAVTVDGGEDDLYDESSDTEFVLLQLMVDLHNMAEGDSITFKIYTTEDGTERQISSDLANTFVDAQDPARVEIVSSGNEIWGREGIRICAVKNAGTSRAVIAYWRDAKRGS